MNGVRTTATLTPAEMNDITAQTGYGFENLEDFTLTGEYHANTLHLTTVSAIEMPTAAKDGDPPKVTLKISGKATVDLTYVKASGSVEVEWVDPPSGTEVLETQMEIEEEVLAYCGEVSLTLAQYVVETLWAKICAWLAENPPEMNYYGAKEM